jgi:hypothetical protein
MGKKNQNNQGDDDNAQDKFNASLWSNGGVEGATCCLCDAKQD